MKKILLTLLFVSAGGLAGQVQAAILTDGEAAPARFTRAADNDLQVREPPLVLAQSDDAGFRINQLEEQLRKLNGRIEDLNFQMLEMQEQMRQRQEDNQYRLQELEEKQGNAGGRKTNSAIASTQGQENGLGKSEPSGQIEGAASLDGSVVVAKKPRRTIDGVEIYEGASGVDDNTGGSLGTIQFDENGNIVDTALGKPLDLTSKFSGGNQAAGPGVLPDDPDTLFDLGYELIQTGRYGEAENVFSSFSERFANHPRIADARFWLGESYLGRNQFESAAKTYLDAHKKWPNSRFGPQTLLKLGVSIAGMNQRELACATYVEVIEKYPDASRAVRRNVALEQRAANCLTN